MQTSWLVVLTAVLASLLEIIDSSIVNVAIPHMQGNLGVTIEEVSWVATGYIISNAVVLPIAAWLGVKIGRKTYYTSCILLFTIASLFCGIAPNFVFLVIARVIQGAAGGALLPTSQAIIQEQFPGEKSGMGSAIYGMSVMVGPAIGPTLGGYLTDHFNWRAIFFINLPIGIVATLLSYSFIEDGGKAEAENKNKKVDWLGFALLILGIGSLQFLLERGQQDDWFASNLILVSAVVTAISLPFFFAWESRVKDPMVEVKLFKESPVRNGSMLMALTGLILYAVIFLVPIYTNTALGMDATHTGLLYLPSTLVTIAVMPIVGALLPKIGAKPFILMGIFLICYSLVKLSQFTSQAGSSDLLTAFYFRAVGMGFMFVPINSLVLSQYTGQTLGQVSGLLNLSRQIGGSIGIAAISTYLDRYSAQFRNDLRSFATTVNPQAIQMLKQQAQMGTQKLQSWVGSNLGAIGFGNGTTSALKGIFGQMEKQVFQLSFNRLMIMIALTYAFALIPLFRLQLKKNVTLGAQHGE